MSQAAAAQRRTVTELGPQNIQATRFVFFAGNVIDPTRAREFSDLLKYNVGGIEVDSPCLHALEDWEGFVGRCRITPVLYYGKPCPRQLLAEGERPVKLSEAPQIAVPEAATTGRDYMSGGVLGNPAAASVGYRTYPGEHVQFITEEGSRLRRGVVQLSSLFEAGLEWEEVEGLGLQEMFFPDLTRLPKTLAEVEDRINSVHGDRLVQKLQKEMLKSCAQFRVWATAHLDMADQQVQKGVNQAGFSIVYSPLDLLLMEQLGRERVDTWQNTQASMQTMMAQAVNTLATQNAEILKMNQRQMDNRNEIAAKMQTPAPVEPASNEPLAEELPKVGKPKTR